MPPAAPARASGSLLGRLRGWEANPVLVKELRSRFRGPRAFVLVSLAAVMVGWPTLLIEGMRGSLSSDPSRLGANLFQSMRSIETALVLVLAPALTFASISGEREHQTLDLLLATPQSAGAIARGKLLAALAYLLLIVTSVVPVLGLAFTLGGVSWLELVRSQAAILVGGLSLASVGLVVSAHARYTGRAAVLAYGAAGFLCIAPLLMFKVRPLPAFLSPIVLAMVLEGKSSVFPNLGVDVMLLQGAALFTQGLVVLTCWDWAARGLEGGRSPRNRVGTVLLALAWLLLFLLIPRLSGA